MSPYSIAGLHRSAEHDHAVALVGIGCRFAGRIVDPGSFWEALAAGQDCIGSIPQDRWNTRRFHSETSGRPDRIVTCRGGFIDEAAHFDAEFFGISPREAEAMDPQQRQLLEVVYEAIEDGCIHPDVLAGREIGVFVGASGHDYSDLQQLSAHAGMYTNTGGASSMLANRVSYHFDFRGPSLVVDTACSSSAAAVHLACRALKSGECRAAIAAGVSLLFNPKVSIGFSRAGMLSPEGLSRPFDAAANGYVRSEGVGAIVLMPLAEARAQAVPIYALVAASAMNQDGTTPGITHPSEDAQTRLLSDVYGRLGIGPEGIAYIEAHGTGTPVGDRAEAAALNRSLGSARPAGSPLPIGSVKGNIGHCEAASGIAGVIKVALCLKHRSWARSINCSALPPDLAQMNLRVQAAAERWPPGEKPRIAGVNSFGFGGTNVHIALSEAPLAPEPVRIIQKTARRLPVAITAQGFSDCGLVRGATRIVGSHGFRSRRQASGFNFQADQLASKFRKKSARAGSEVQIERDSRMEGLRPSRGERMPITIFDTTGISSTRRERIEAAVEFGGKHVAAPHEAWIATDQQGKVRVIVTGPGGFQRTVIFPPDETPAVITEMIRATRTNRQLAGWDLGPLVAGGRYLVISPS